jgi:hypothetical protein
VPVLAVLAGLFAVLLVYDSATQAAHAGWPLVTTCFLLLVIVALAFWHRRKMAEFHHMRLEHVGRYEQIYKFRPWPKMCHYCAMPIASWKQANVHDDEETSPCTVLLMARERLEREASPVDTLPMAPGFSAEVVGQDEVPQAPGYRPQWRPEVPPPVEVPARSADRLGAP